jgi:2-phospho-L-lactate guanylyltransferase
MRYLLIPVKDLTSAKQRLRGLLTQEERTRLAWAMCENAFAAASQSRLADRIAIVTLYPPAITLAKKYGMEIILETEQISESASVDFGSREAKARGAETVLRLPIDLPLVTAADIDRILQSPADVVLVPSRDGTGTNALLRRPPDLFPSRFGTDSLRKHLAEADRLGAQSEVLACHNLALDLDDPPDLAFFLRQKSNSPIADLLIEIKVPARLAALQDGPTPVI